MKIIVILFWWCCGANFAMGLFTTLAKSTLQKRLVNPGEWGIWWGGSYGWHYLVGSGLTAVVMYLANVHLWLFS